MMKEVLNHTYGSCIFDKLIKESDVTIKEWDLCIKNINDFKEEFRCFKEFKEESDCLCQDAFDRFINVDLKLFVEGNINDEFKQSGTSSTGSGSSTSSRLSMASS